MRLPLPDPQIGALLGALSGFEVVGTDSSLVLDAHQLAVAEQLSWFDALINVLFSKDFNDGRVIAGLRAVNPFRSMPG